MNVTSANSTSNNVQLGDANDFIQEQTAWKDVDNFSEVILAWSFNIWVEKYMQNIKLRVTLFVHLFNGSKLDLNVVSQLKFALLFE